MKAFMPTFILAAVVTILLLCFGGCGAPHVIDAPSKHYVIIRQSGGVITDVWVLPESDLIWQVYRDRWHFTDVNNNTITVDQDAKIIEVWDRNDLELYHEYHAEFESEPYRKEPC